MKNQNSNQKSGSKVKVRPDFDRTMCGVTTGRASKAWHFLRRDIVRNKTKALVNKRCFEKEFANCYLSESESGDGSFDSDTSYESDSEDNQIESLPFQLAERGWVSPSSLQFVGRSNVQKKPSPLPSIKDGLSIDVLLESEIVMTRSNSTFTSPLVTPNPDSDTVAINKTCDKDTTEATSTKLTTETLLDSFDTPINIVIENVAVKSSTQPLFIDSMLEQGLIDYFTNRPARFRRIKQKTLSGCNEVQPIKLKLIKKKAKRASSYNGLCNLVTVLNRKNGHFVDNSNSSTLYDLKGYKWEKQDLPSFVTINTDKFTDSKVGFRQRKKNIDSFVNALKSKTVVKYKPVVESPSCLVDLDSFSQQKMEQSMTSVSETAVESEGSVDGVTKESSNDSSEDEVLKVKAASEFKKKEAIFTKTASVKKEALTTKQPISNKADKGNNSFYVSKDLKF